MTGHTTPPNISRAELAELHRRKVAARERVRDYVQAALPDAEAVDAQIRALMTRTGIATGDGLCPTAVPERKDPAR